MIYNKDKNANDIWKLSIEVHPSIIAKTTLWFISKIRIK